MFLGFFIYCIVQIILKEFKSEGICAQVCLCVWERGRIGENGGGEYYKVKQYMGS